MALFGFGKKKNTEEELVQCDCGGMCKPSDIAAKKAAEEAEKSKSSGCCCGGNCNAETMAEAEKAKVIDAAKVFAQTNAPKSAAETAQVKLLGERFTISDASTKEFMRQFAQHKPELVASAPAPKPVKLAIPASKIEWPASPILEEETLGAELWNKVLQEAMSERLLKSILEAVRYKGFNPFHSRQRMMAMLTPSCLGFLKSLAILVGSRGTKLGKMPKKSQDREFVRLIVESTQELGKIDPELTVPRAASCFPEYQYRGRFENSSLYTGDTALIRLLMEREEKEACRKIFLKSSLANAEITKTADKWSEETMIAIFNLNYECPWQEIIDHDVLAGTRLKYP